MKAAASILLTASLGVAASAPALAGPSGDTVKLSALNGSSESGTADPSHLFRRSARWPAGARLSGQQPNAQYAVVVRCSASDSTPVACGDIRPG